MTKQTYRSAMEELQAENMELKKQVRDLKQQLEQKIFDDRKLDAIIESYKEEKQIPSMPSSSKGSKLSVRATDFMSQYKKYRQLINAEPKKTEIDIDNTTLNVLMKKFKPA